MSFRIRRDFIKLSVAVVLSLGLAQRPLAAQPADEPKPVAQSPEAKAADEAFRRQDWAAAARLYEKITTEHPQAGGAWYRLGYARHALAEYDKAIPAHRKAAEFPAVRPTALYNLACALALTGDKEAAFVALGDSIDAGFNDVKQLESDADLKSLRGDDRLPAMKRKATPIAELVKEFDFWVGDWNVFDAKGNQIGTNRIEKAEAGCLIVENWSNMQGNTGRSINFIDPADRRWKQIWVDGGGTVVRYDGDVRDGAMHFSGTYAPQRGKAVAARATLTPQPDGKVRHVIEHSGDNGKSWQPYFDGLYIRKDAATSDEKPA